ncbi:hypothetical protein PVAG01_08069 [Phlyctema vagabunda]|uniref:DUF7729 domain-containing protein n=1 Tax=Phlyctema vagabunda TaxID=108571 RepID=A0ABR4P903_9HELO
MNRTHQNDNEDETMHPDRPDARQNPSPSHHLTSPSRIWALSGNCSKQGRAHHHHHQHHRILFLCLLICFFIVQSAAQPLSGSSLEEQMIEVDENSESASLSPSPREKLLPEDDLLGSTLDRLARTGTILVDQRPPPVPVSPTSWELANVEEAIQLRIKQRRWNKKRQVTASASSTPTATVSTTTTASVLVVAATDTATSLPTPFDSGFSNNITDSCNAFLDNVLNNATFKKCLPFSLLLQSSNSFFQISKSLVRTTQLLDYTCSANVTTCSVFTSSIAANLSLAENCGSDLANQNPLVQEALLGFDSYQILYQASCLRDPNTASYCFADAVTNSSSPTDSYPYYLPLNVSLPGGSQPTCDMCLRNTMEIFAAASSNRTNAIASTYASAAQIINVGCGPGFVNATLPAPAVTGSASSLAFPNTALLALVLVVGSWLV